MKPPRGTLLNRTHPLARGLTGCWLTNEGTGANLFDYSGNGNNGPLTNMDAATDWVSSERGWALDFDGSNDYVYPGLGVLPSGAYTKAAWVWRDTSGGNRNIVSGNAGTAFWASTSNKLASGHNGSWFLVQDAATLALNEWIFTAVTFDPNVSSGTMLLYKNAVEIDSATSVATQNNLDVYIGAFSGVYTWLGKIGDVYIWDRALSASEILALYMDTYAMFRRPSRATAFGTLVAAPATFDALLLAGD